MRLHHITITPKHVTIDGVPIIVEASGPSITHPYQHNPAIRIVNIPVLAEAVELQGDSHEPDAPTPIYDQLIVETRARQTVARIREVNARAVAERLRKDRA